MSEASANLPNLSESLQLHFVLAELQLHLLQLLLQRHILLQHLEVQLKGNNTLVKDLQENTSVCLFQVTRWKQLVEVSVCGPGFSELHIGFSLEAGFLVCVVKVGYVPVYNQMHLTADSHCRDT